jgi:predicted DCC family thiol-disulfide oxidoreductase YuxK
MTKPLLIFDGDCGFCRKWIARWQRLTVDRVDYAPYQEVGERFPQIPTRQFEEGVQLIRPNGEILSGAHAVFATLAVRPGFGWLLWFYRCIPGFGVVCDLAYRTVARNRKLFSRIF